MNIRLAIVTTHPVQYYAPWFRCIARSLCGSLRVFYLWDSGVRETYDRGFDRSLRWDVPLLEGYDAEFVHNVSTDPGTHHFFGLRNPDLSGRIEEFRPDAILLIGYRFASLVQLVHKWHRRVPLLLRGDSHRLGPRPESVASVVRERLLRIWFRRFQAFLFVGKANRDYFEMLGAPAERLFFAPHSVDNARFAADVQDRDIRASEWRRELGIPAGDRVVLFAGKFEAKKRPLDLLSAFRKVDVQRCSLLFVGNGPLEEGLRAAAAGDSRVRFAPFQNQSLMPRTYAAADLFVLPSFGTSETWGLAVNEAMAVGRGVLVSSHVGCASDLVVEGTNGFVFPAGNVDALAECLRRAMSDDELLAAWGSESRRIIANFSYESATEGLLSALDFVTAPSSFSRNTYDIGV